MNLAWIGVDWGTTRVRAWAMDASDAPVAFARSAAGMGTLEPRDYEPALLALIGPWLDARDGDAGASVPVLVCGMAGARQGWLEAPYAPVPGRPLVVDGLVSPTLDDPRLAVSLLPGLSQHEPPDVMRGEETQIAGALALGGDPDAVLCLPGTHTKWVRLEGGRVAGFATALTGELFAALGRHTVLRHSIAPDAWDEASFLEALTHTLQAPESLSTRLFAIRAASLVGAPPEGAGSATLSGLLIGAELAATRRWWRDRRPVVVGEGELAGRYAAALEAVGAGAGLLDGDEAVRAGLVAARHLVPGLVPGGAS